MAKAICYFLFMVALISNDFKALSDTKKLTKPTYLWTRLLKNGPWKKSYNFQMFSHHDTIWVFHPDGNWFSSDGKKWIKSNLPNAINNLAFLDYVQYKNAMYGLGHFEGNIEEFKWQSTIYKTDDLKKWNVLAQKSNLPNLFFYHPFSFNDRLWIIGGENRETQFADIWNSEDGIKWTKVRSDAPFGKRSQSQIVKLNNKLFLLNNDVWSSTDAVNWRQETKEIVKGIEIFGYSAVVMDGRIWLLGCNRNGQFSSKVLSSPDGKTWREQDAPWSPRGGIASTAHKGKIYMTGGKYGGANPSQPDFEYSNDLWVLEKK